MISSIVNSAPVGYIGKVIVFGMPVRASSCGIKAHQPIYHPDPASNNPEQPMWHFGPIEVEGDISMPVVFGDSSWKTFFEYATKKIKGQLQAGEIKVFWPPGGINGKGYGRLFSGCMINRLTIKGSAGERIEATLSIIGMSVSEESDVGDLPFDMAPVTTWDMVSINGKDLSSQSLSGCEIKEFSIEINNNLSRNNTFCIGQPPAMSLEARSISTGKRQVSGSLTFLGSAPTQKKAIENIRKITSDDKLTIDIGGMISLEFQRITYEYQTIDINSGIVNSTITWHAHGGGPGAPSLIINMANGIDNANKQLQREMANRKIL